MPAGLVLLSACAETIVESASINFYLGSKLLASHSVQQMQLDLDAHTIEIDDVEYKKRKRYQAFLFDDVLQHIFGDSYAPEDWNSISFVALDGYNAVIDRQFFGEGDAYLVFKDHDFPDWEAIPNHGDETAAPFYLIWTKEEKIPQNGYSWPWSISDIALINLANEYAETTPDSSAVSPDIFSGYTLYMRRCNSCHSLGGQGGLIGPDLNAPMNILDYRSEEMVRAFITESSKFRRGRMPDFKDLSEEQVDQLIAYLTYLKEEKNASG